MLFSLTSLRHSKLSLIRDSLRHYRTDNSIFQWIHITSLTGLHGVVLEPVSVQSGVPQGTVLGPLMLLLHINDISQHIKSPLKLFTDNSIVYRIINTHEDVT